MEELFGLDMDIIMVVLLAFFLPITAGVGIVASRNRVRYPLAPDRHHNSNRLRVFSGDHFHASAPGLTHLSRRGTAL